MTYGSKIFGSEPSGLDQLKIRVHVNGEDKTGMISVEGFEIEKNITNRVDTARFKIVGSHDSLPSVLDEVEIYRDTTPEVGKLFGGHITEIERTIDGMVPIVSVMCQDYSFRMNSKLVVREYENTTVDALIADMISTFSPAGYTTNNVSANVPVTRIRFNYQTVSKCLQELAELYGYDWYVDEYKDIHFFKKFGQDAPFNLDDTSGNYDFQSLGIIESVDEIKNAIFVRGGEIISQTTTSENLDNQVDGESDIFKVGYRYRNYTLTVGGSPVSVGIDHLQTFEDPENYYALYNFQEKLIRFRNAPVAGDKPIVFSGNIYIPISIFRRDTDSISEVGQEFQFKIDDKQILDSDTALLRARAELDSFARSLKSGSFLTDRNELHPGQKITIQSDIRGLDNEYIISRVMSRTITPFDFKHEVEFITTKTSNFIDLMQNLLLERNKNIDIDENEVPIIEFFEEIDPQLQIWDTEATTANPWGLDSEVRWVAGSPYQPVSGIKRTPRAQVGGPQAITYV